ncbi:MAG: NUDIX hydrolase [Bacteroidetes bacterium]|nr:NUDIX hydrolase [Bacteroidota bacterium]
MASRIIEKIYGNKTRIRVCGILIEQNKLLMVNHSGLNSENIFWSVPGGGVNENEGIKEALVREFREEVNLEVKIGPLMHIKEAKIGALHAIEFYFEVYAENQKPRLGQDPEHNILTEIAWKSIEEYRQIKHSQRISIFEGFNSFNDFTSNISFLNLLDGANFQNNR